jgi:dUTP pyrophosphatase
MLILPGVIDAGYRGQIFAMAFNPTDAQIVIKKGERVAQLLFFQRVTGLTTTVVSELRPSDRLTKGFGSSGK